MFAKNLRLIYLYLVSLIALFVTVFAMIATANAIMNAIIGYSGSYYMDTMLYTSRYRQVFNSCAFWMVSLPVYLFHWREIENNRKTSIAETEMVTAVETGLETGLETEIETEDKAKVGTGLETEVATGAETETEIEIVTEPEKEVVTGGEENDS